MTLTTEFDGPWKDIIEHRFEDFMSFFFPQVHGHIDWSKGYTFLDQELQKLLRKAVITKGRRVDKLVKVSLNSGQQELLYLHIEVQSQEETEFPKRVFIYHYRLYDRYGPNVTTLVVLGDDNPTWRPTSYRCDTIGNRLEFEFATVKILDYAKNWQSLTQSRNPFSIVVRVHLKALETHHSPLQRRRWKMALFKAMYEEGYSKTDIIELFHFLDWVMVLPDHLEQQFDDFVQDYEEEQQMPYVTNIERRGIQKGITQGRQEGIQLGLLQQAQESLLEVLTLRFRKVPKRLVQQLQAIEDRPQLSHWLKQAVVVESLSQFESLMESSGLTKSPRRKKSS